jgi:hypothetical protein
MLAAFLMELPSPTATQHSLKGGALPPYPHRTFTGWNAPASPGALITDFINIKVIGPWGGPMSLVNQFQEEQLPTQIAPAERRLTAAEFQTLADVPPETEWFANIKNPHTKRAYKNAVADFMRFTGRSEEFRIITRAHVIAWRIDLEHREIGPRTNKRTPEGATIRHRLAALSSSSNVCATKTPSATTRSKASNGQRPTPAKEKRRHWATIMPASC